MKIWMIISLILALGLGLSIYGLLLGYRQGLWRNVVRYFFVGLFGAVIAALIMVVIIIAVWPPYDTISLLLSAAFIMLLAGGLYFVRATEVKQDPNPLFYRSEENIS